MEETTTKKKPLSLNERALLLSATFSKRPLNDVVNHLPTGVFDPPTFNLESPPPQNEDVSSNIPLFDFDSPSGKVVDQPKLHTESSPPKNDAVVDDVPSFNFESSSDVAKMSKEKLGDFVEEDWVFDDGIPNQSALTDFDSHLEKTEVKKVRIQGRRRLCKVTTHSDDIAECAEEEEESRQFFDVSDFSPSPPGKDVGCGGDEIRDILNDLSSRMEFLSIEKKKIPRPVDLKAVPLAAQVSEVVMDNIIDKKKDQLAKFEYTSAGSSFTSSSDQFSTLSGGGDAGQSKEVECATLIESDEDSFAEVTKPVVFKREPSKSAAKWEPSKSVAKKGSATLKKSLNEKSAVSKRASIFNFEDETDENDCVEVGSHGWKRAGQQPDGVKKKGITESYDVEVVDDAAYESPTRDEHTIILKDPRSSYELPPKIGKMLYPHQRDGIKWLWSLHCKGKGGILGDDMGLGKTMQMAGYLAGLFFSRLIRKVMIVAPKTLIPHWIKELSAVGLSKMIKEYFGTCTKLRQYELQTVLQDKGILLTTYDIVRNNAKQLCGCGFYDEDIDDTPLWDYMILDEGHLIKNPSTQRAKSLLEIPCARRIIISGTPIQNNLKELWALFNFCCPNLLGDKQEFKERYEHPILRGNDKKASDRDKRIGSIVAKELRERIHPYFLRRMKSEVFRDDGPAENAKLSQKNEIIVWLQLTSSQRHLYEAFLKSEIVLSAFDGSPLAAITILKKICDHPYLLTKRAAEDLLEGMDNMLNQDDRGLAERLAMHAADLTEEDDIEEKHANVSCKISFILSLLAKLIPEGHNVLIFSQTRKMLNLIQESLLAHGFEFMRIDGTTKANDRLRIVNEFQEGHGAPIFLLTSQVGGLGLTLTKADRVIVVDPAWNPSTDSQSVDRAYRIGQTKDVIVYRLITCGTIEEKMYRMQVFKGGLFKTATESKEQTRYFTQQDLKELFSLPKDGFDVSPTQQQLQAEHGDQISMSDYLRDHIQLLESFGIGGVSHHSLLYSKSEPTRPMPAEEEEVRRMGTTVRRHCGGSSTDRPVDGSQYAFKPKDVNIHKGNSSPDTPAGMTESEIKERIKRLHQLLSNKTTVSKLPDKGEKLRKQMLGLALELENMEIPEQSCEIIDLGDISDKMKSSLRV